MNKLINSRSVLHSFLICLFSFALLSCSDDSSDKNKERITFDHTHGPEVTSLKKHTFEHKFADQCVKREMSNSGNTNKDKKKFEKACLCIAGRMMRDLTAVEAEKFLVEKKNTHSLKMSFDEAAFFCLQDRVKPKPAVMIRNKS